MPKQPPRRPRRPKDPILLPLIEFAALTPYQPRRIEEMVTQGVLPLAARRPKKLDVVTAMPALWEYHESVHHLAASSDMAEMKRREQAAVTRLKELAVQEAERGLVSSDEVATALDGMAVAYCQQLEGLPGRLAVPLERKSRGVVRSLLGDEIRRVREWVSGQLAELADRFAKRRSAA